MAPSGTNRTGCTRINKNKADTKSSSNVSNSKINNRIANLLSSIKVKKSFEIGFLISEASLAFIQLRKVVTKALILYYFNPKHHI